MAVLRTVSLELGSDILSTSFNSVQKKNNWQINKKTIPNFVFYTGANACIKACNNNSIDDNLT